MTEWVTAWRPGARRLSEDTIDKMMADCKNFDLIEPDGPVILTAYPAIISGASRLVNWDEAIGSAVLYPCAHPVQMRAGNTEAINTLIAQSFPVRCGHCMRENP